MSRKKIKFHKRFIWIPAIAITGLVLVLLIPTLSTLGEINPFYNSDDFTVAELSVQDQEKNDEINMMIEETLMESTSLCGVSQQELNSIKQCNTLTMNEQFVNTELDSIDTSVLVSCGLTESQVDECTSEINQIIKELSDQLIQSQNPLNDTEFSDDSFEEQLCDLTECPEASAVTLESKIVKISSNGERFESISTFDIPLQSIFVEDSTNIDFRNGFLEVEMFALTNPNVKLSGSGKMDILVNEDSVIENPFDITIETGENIDGRVRLLISDSQKISISLSNLFSSFADKSVTPIQLKIQEIQFTDERNIFQKNDFIIFTMDIFRDDLLIIIEDEEANLIRSLPMDSRIVIHSSASASTPYVDLCHTRQQIYESYFLGNGVGCTAHQLTTNRVGNPCLNSGTSKTVQVPAPSISGITVKDSDGNIIVTSTGGTGNSLFDYSQLLRNQTYSLSVSGIGSTQLDYGINQETKSFTCTQKGTPKLKGFTETSGSFTACSTVIQNSYTILNTDDPLTLGSKTCNFP